MLTARRGHHSLLSKSSASVTFLVPRSCQKPCHPQLVALPSGAFSGATGSRPTTLRRTPAPLRAMATAGTVLAFTPQHAALGGTILGVAVVSNLLLCGRVLGISGAVKGLVQDAHGRSETWRWAFIAGLMAAAPFLASLLPTSFEPMAPTVTVARSVLSGLFVGVGTAMGNGCTSGHGICGNSRLSVRSMVYTLTFMVAGALAATLSNATAALQIAPTPPAFQPLSAAERSIGLSLLVGGTLLMLGIAAAYKTLYKAVCGPTQSPASSALQSGSGGDESTPTLTPRSSTTGKTSPPSPSINISSKVNSSNPSVSRLASVMQTVASAAIGVVFSAGLAMSGMTKPSKVVGFLSALSPSWDLSLMFVMASAIGISIFAFQAVMGTWFKLPPGLRTPLMAAKYSLPTGSQIDAQLIFGGILFGTGWGLSGMCPGPAMLVAASPVASTQVWLYLASMAVGMKLQPVLMHLPQLGARMPATN